MGDVELARTGPMFTEKELNDMCFSYINDAGCRQFGIKTFQPGGEDP